MEQRIYQGAVAPEGLADHLVQQYEPQRDLQAQKVGQGDSFVVQIGRGDEPEEIRNAVSVAVARTPGAESGVVVTMGQQQWITPQIASHALLFGLISAMVTPWALFGLLWPVSQAITATALPRDIWETIAVYMASQGAVLSRTEDLQHPAAI